MRSSVAVFVGVAERVEDKEAVRLADSDGLGLVPVTVAVEVSVKDLLSLSSGVEECDSVADTVREGVGLEAENVTVPVADADAESVGDDDSVGAERLADTSSVCDVVVDGVAWVLVAVRSALLEIDAVAVDVRLGVGRVSVGLTDLLGVSIGVIVGGMACDLEVDTIGVAV